MVRPEDSGGTITLPLDESRVKDTIKRIHEYVWARHIDGSDHYDHSIVEDEALQALDEFYSGIGNRNSPDQVYLGILLFERAFEFADEQAELFARARRIFEFYRRVTGEDDWPAWCACVEAIGDRVALIGDDLFTTNPERIRCGIAQRAANAVLVKLPAYR